MEGSDISRHALFTHAAIQSDETCCEIVGKDDIQLSINI